MTRFQINPGEYRHIIVFQKKDKTQNSYGEEEENWTDFLQTRAAVLPISGKEFFAAETVTNETTHKVKTRYVPDKEITPNMRILLKKGNRIFEITSPPINFQEKNIELQIMCKEVF